MKTGAKDIRILFQKGILPIIYGPAVRTIIDYLIHQPFRAGFFSEKLERAIKVVILSQDVPG